MLQPTDRLREPLYWDDTYPIALSLNAAHADVADPSLLSLAQLHSWVTALDDFADDREQMPVEWLEQIQVEWIELK